MQNICKRDGRVFEYPSPLSYCADCREAMKHDTEGQWEQKKWERWGNIFDRLDAGWFVFVPTYGDIANHLTRARKRHPDRKFKFHTIRHNDLYRYTDISGKVGVPGDTLIERTK